MRIYIIANDGITLCRELPATVNKGEVAVASREELHAARLSGKRLVALWNALPNVEKQTKVDDRDKLIDQLWSAIEALPDPEQPSDRETPVEARGGDRDATPTRGRNRRRSRKRDGLAAAHGPGAVLRNSEEEAWADPRLSNGGARPGLSHRRPGPGMRRAIQDATACREALWHLPKLGLGELRQQWRVLYKAEASAYLSPKVPARPTSRFSSQ